MRFCQAQCRAGPAFLQAGPHQLLQRADLPWCRITAQGAIDSALRPQANGFPGARSLRKHRHAFRVISSIAANRGNSWAPAYSASKSFQSNYFEALAIKAKRMKKDIGITCIEPGFVVTKMAKGNKQFWVVPLEKAAIQMIAAIKKKKRKVYVSRRWWLVAKLMRLIPFWIYKRIG